MSRVAALVIAIACGSACSGKSSSTTTPGGATVIVAKKMRISWGVSPMGNGSDVYLASTDETGGQVSHSVGHYAGTCAAASAAPAMKALMTVMCQSPDGGGDEIDAVVRDGEVIILHVRFESGITPDPMGRERVTSIPIPIGTAVEVAR